jgi:hypothetical protein
MERKRERESEWEKGIYTHICIARERERAIIANWPNNRLSPRLTLLDRERERE